MPYASAAQKFRVPAWHLIELTFAMHKAQLYALLNAHLGSRTIFGVQCVLDRAADMRAFMPVSCRHTYIS